MGAYIFLFICLHVIYIKFREGGEYTVGGINAEYKKQGKVREGGVWRG